MALVTLKPNTTPELYLECYNISPDTFAGKTLMEIADLDLHEGKIKAKLGDFFEITGSPGKTAEETNIRIIGDCSRMKYIGNKMTAGTITVEGDADMYVGGWMKGGKIHVIGNVDSFCGIAMEGGEIVVDGDAQNHVGSAYRGDWRGMRGGTIRIRGNAGNDIGTFMLGGTIIIEKDAFIHVSTHAEGGTVIIKGDVQGRVGGQMVKGDIYVLGKVQYMLPGFKKTASVEKEIDGLNATFTHYIGDLGERHPKSKGQQIYGNLYVLES
ncbi:MAG: formylmethanofuran dehydrogenase subunit C [Methanocalculus sp.]|uniref:formylmethanofuran dehydrogenase subunit C n=1 Tax=Methanocalculus sp. TaxID=2004547 RepID=UPI00271DD1E3|nr:formylmethanofuran dehydrogenase subunit C [Methanocalculus sp.]MDO9540529.1 formylmethanofuran dehydrogenase subunit C [Methanocalculus sp.]